MFKFCSASALIGWKGDDYHLRAGSVWLADDPLVLAYPGMFSDAPAVVETSGGAVYRGVEQASAAPGEKRNR